jgi:hypothetical protein
MIPDDAWPVLSERFGLHPRDWWLTPEEGGLTWGQWDAYVSAANEPPQHVQGVVLCEPPN